MIIYRKLGVLILSLIILSVFAAVSVNALSEENDSIGDVPDLPLILHGGLDLNGEPAETGSEIVAYYEGELIAKSIVEDGGRYSLNLNLTPENYTDIGKVEIYVKRDKASFEASQIEAIKNKTPGSIYEVNMTYSTSSGNKDESSSGSSNPEGEVRIVKKDSSESNTSDESTGSSEAGFAGEDDTAYSEGPVSQVDNGESEDVENVEGAEGTEGSEDAGYSTIFTMLLFVAALFGAFMVIKR